MLRIRYLLCILSFGSLCISIGCGTRYDVTSGTGKQGIIDDVNTALTQGDCGRAVNLIEPLYQSAQTDNQVRVLRSAAQACATGFNFFTVMDGLTTNSLVGNLLWQTATKLFPSVSTDNKLAAGWLAIESLLMPVNPKINVPFENKVYATGFNTGSVNISDRTADANAYLTFISLASIGIMNNRFGKLDSEDWNGAYIKTQDLPWQTATSMASDTNGCAYASSVMNFFDGLQWVLPYVSVSAGATLQSAATTFAGIIDRACMLGCAGIAAGDPSPTWFSTFSYNTGCTLSKTDAQALCSKCPLRMRSRLGCQNQPNVPTANNPEACAAAGIIQFINQDPILGWN